MLRIFLRSTILRFGDFARWADLALGIITISLGIYWELWWVICLGIFSLFAFAINLNGKIQNWAKGKATNYVEKKK
jgi:hypothetical protein